MIFGTASIIQDWTKKILSDVQFQAGHLCTLLWVIWQFPQPSDQEIKGIVVHAKTLTWTSIWYSIFLIPYFLTLPELFAFHLSPPPQYNRIVTSKIKIVPQKWTLRSITKEQQFQQGHSNVKTIFCLPEIGSAGITVNFQSNLLNSQSQFRYLSHRSNLCKNN
jgi:hypothetical protein